MSTEVQGYILEFSERGTKVVKGRIESLGKAGAKTAKQFRLLKLAIGTLTAHLSISHIVAYTDAWQKLTNQLKIVTTTQKNLVAVRQELINVSRDGRADISALGQLYQRLALQTANLGASQQELIDFVEGSSKALAITTANAQESRAVMLQLGQALGTAAVNGDEFRTIAESAPRLLKAVADDMGITTGQVKKLTSEGKLMSKEFFRHVLNQLPLIRAEFEKTDITLGQAGIIFNNALKISVGRIMEATGAATKLSGVIVAIADKIKEWTEEVIVWGSVLSDVFANMVKERTLGQALLDIFGAAGRLLVDVVITGFNAMEPVFKALGRFIANGFFDAVSNFMPAIGAKLNEMLLQNFSKNQLKKMVQGLSVEDLYSSVKATSPSLSVQRKTRNDDYRRLDMLHSKVNAARNGTLSEREYRKIVAHAMRLKIITRETVEEAGNITEALSLDKVMASWQTNFDKLSKDSQEKLNVALAGLGITLDDLREKAAAVRKELAFNKESGEGLDNDKLEKHVGLLVRMRAAFSGINEMAKKFPSSALEGVKQGFIDLKAEATNFKAVLTDITKNAIKQFSDSLTEAITGGEADFRSLARTALNALISIMIQALITTAVVAALNAIAPGAGTALGASSGSGSATASTQGGNVQTAQFGSYVMANSPTRVGETKEELWVPSSAGRVANYEKGTQENKGNITLINAVPSAIDEMATPEGSKVLINFVKNHKREIKGIVG